MRCFPFENKGRSEVMMGVGRIAGTGAKWLVGAGIAALATMAVAQTVPGQDSASAPNTGLDLPSTLEIFGKADPNVRKPTAIVNDYVITGTEVDQRVALVTGMQKLTLKPEEREQLKLAMLRQLIDETLEIQEAKANEIKIEPREVESSFARVAARFQKTPEQMRAWLREIGSSERSIKRQVEAELAWSRLLRRRVNVNVGEAEVKAMIDRLTAQKGTDEYHVYEIYQNATPDRAQEVSGGMQKMIEQMRQGTPFDYLARTYSQSSTRARGGDLGWIQPAMLPEALAQAVQDMQPGQVAGPIPLSAGFSIVYLADKHKVGVADPRDAKLSLRQLSLSFAKGTTEAQASSRAAAFAKATQAIRGCGDVSKVAAAEGAEVVDRDNIVIKDLPPALQNLILPLQVGQSTQPFGSIEDGVRVLVICGRDDPPAAYTPSVEQVQEQLEDQRVNLRAERMLRDLRRDALIEYR